MLSSGVDIWLFHIARNQQTDRFRATGPWCLMTHHNGLRLYPLGTKEAHKKVNPYSRLVKFRLRNTWLDNEERLLKHPQPLHHLPPPSPSILQSLLKEEHNLATEYLLQEEQSWLLMQLQCYRGLHSNEMISCLIPIAWQKHARMSIMSPNSWNCWIEWIADTAPTSCLDARSKKEMEGKTTSESSSAFWIPYAPDNYNLWNRNASKKLTCWTHQEIHL